MNVITNDNTFCHAFGGTLKVTNVCMKKNPYGLLLKGSDNVGLNFRTIGLVVDEGRFLLF